MKVVILPGMDGTGLGLEPFCAALAPEFDAAIITYPSQTPLTYAQLADYVQTRLPNEPYLLLGESFSGPIALGIAASTPQNLEGLILAASFARYDHLLKPILQALAAYVSPNVAPRPLLNWQMIGTSGSSELREALHAALTSVAAPVLRLRALQALQIDVSGARIKLPTLYLAARRDRVMPRSASSVIAKMAAQFSTKEFDAPHFLLQTQPEACAAAVKTFYATMNAAALGLTPNAAPP